MLLLTTHLLCWYSSSWEETSLRIRSKLWEKYTHKNMNTIVSSPRTLKLNWMVKVKDRLLIPRIKRMKPLQFPAPCLPTAVPINWDPIILFWENRVNLIPKLPVYLYVIFLSSTWSGWPSFSLTVKSFTIVHDSFCLASAKFMLSLCFHMLIL